jgi:hypothetical protein
MNKDQDFRLQSADAKHAIQHAYSMLVGHEPDPARLLWELQNLYKKAFSDGVNYEHPGAVGESSR